jgi:putative transferase (TIGR04331 family)
MPAFVEIRKTIRVADGKLIRFLNFSEASSVQDIAILLLRALVPISVLERYAESAKEGKELGLPIRPRVIFTSNAFFYDDLFKVYVNNSLSACNYVVAQHGNNYGVSKFSDLYPEFRTPDLFLSWGWTSRIGHVIPFGQIKPRVRAKFPREFQGVSLLVRDEMKSFLCADMAGPNKRYLESLMNLCYELEELGVRTSIRLHSSTSPDQRQLWRDYVAGMTLVTIAQDNVPIDKVIQSGLGVVFTYDSTGMLELGSADVPFFFFASEGLGMVKDEFRSNYRALSEAGLLSSEPAIAAKMIYEWINASPNEQTKKRIAVKKFLSGISFYPRNKLFSLRKILIRSKKASKESRALTNEAE